MRRYQDIPQERTIKGKRYYTNVFYPEIPLSENDIWVITSQGDRLDLLADQYYRDSTLYWIISTANENLKQNSLFIPEGTQIRIPQDIAEIVSAYTQLNNL